MLLLLALLASHEPLTAAALGNASVQSRSRSVVDGKELDEPLFDRGDEPIVFVIDPLGLDRCMPDFASLTATANGASMKRERSGGSHHEVYSGPTHFPTLGDVCDPIRFVISRSDIKPAADGAVTFDVSDGKTTLHFAWAHLLEKRGITGTAAVKPGDPLSFQWTPGTDRFTPMEHGPLQVCLQADDKKACRPKEGEVVVPCVNAAVDDKGLITAVVPQSWTCAPSGTIWIRATVAARPIACSAPSCTSSIQGSTPFTVTIVR
jgi:hypothetical protein